MNTETRILIHIVYENRTLCGKITQTKNTFSRHELDSIPPSAWVSCPICTLAATCHELDATRSQTKRHRASRHSRWTQPQLFN